MTSSRGPRTNPLHKLHAAQLEYTLNTEGWAGVDGYTHDYLGKIGRAVLVSCPQCEDDLSTWHMLRVSRDRDVWSVEAMGPEPVPGVRYTDPQHQPVRYIEVPHA
ncbi:hypothetical protein [Mycobacterium sp.]|uniref:hypothetical protein n=1 Tax=Mycobacterium sp. TaxID=1785 RepID=UPI003BAECE8E